MNIYCLRSKLAKRLIRLVCRYISDAPLRAIHVESKRAVGSKFSYILRTSDTSGLHYKVKASDIATLHNRHLHVQAMIKELYHEPKK